MTITIKAKLKPVLAEVITNGGVCLAKMKIEVNPIGSVILEDAPNDIKIGIIKDFSSSIIIEEFKNITKLKLLILKNIVNDDGKDTILEKNEYERLRVFVNKIGAATILTHKDFEKIAVENNIEKLEKMNDKDMHFALSEISHKALKSFLDEDSFEKITEFMNLGDECEKFRN